MEMSFEKVTGKKIYRKQTFCIIGPPKVGKSSLLEDDRSLYLDIEGGLSHLSVTKFPKDRPFLDYEELEGVVDNLVATYQAGKFPKHIDTVVVDTATRFSALAGYKAIDIMNKKFNKEWITLEEITIGGDKGSPGWSCRTNLVDGILGKLKQLGCAIWIIAHNENKKVKNEVNVDIEKNTIDIGGQLGKGFLRYSDHILNIVAKTTPDGIITRTVRCMNTATIEAGSRGLCLPSSWVMTNPEARTPEAMSKANKINFEFIRGHFSAE